MRASLVAYWQRICMPMQETWVWSLFWEDPTRSLILEDPTLHRTVKPKCHNYWACALDPGSHNYWCHMLQILKPVHPRACVLQEKLPQWEGLAPQFESSPCSLQVEKSPHSNEDPAKPKVNKINKNF